MSTNKDKSQIQGSTTDNTYLLNMKKNLLRNIFKEVPSLLR